jgi:hypothetical protein
MSISPDPATCYLREGKGKTAAREGLKDMSRIILRIEITPEAKDNLQQTTQQSGMTQVALLSRLVEWFSEQPHTLRSAVLDLYPPAIRDDVLKLILKRLDEAPPPKKPKKPAAKRR